MFRVKRLGEWYRLGVGDPDSFPPVLTITAPGISSAADAPFDIVITANEPVYGLALGDITVTNGVASAFTGIDGDMVYGATITPTDYLETSTVIDIAAGVCVDLAGNQNLAADTLTVPLAYYMRVLATQTGNLIAYYRQNDVSGAVAVNDSGAGGFDGAPTNVTFDVLTGPDGSPAPFFDQTAFIDMPVDVANAFNPYAGTIQLWFQVDSIADWTNGVEQYMCYIGTNTTNTVNLGKRNINNAIRARYSVGGVTKTLDFTASPVGWNCLHITYDAAAGATGEAKVFLNGVQQGATQTSLTGVWAGGVPSVRKIGAAISNVLPWLGSLHDVALWDVALTPTEVGNLSVVGPF